MSRIGRLPITVPAGVTVTVDSNNLVTVKGPKGTLNSKIHQHTADDIFCFCRCLQPEFIPFHLIFLLKP